MMTKMTLAWVMVMLVWTSLDHLTFHFQLLYTNTGFPFLNGIMVVTVLLGKLMPKYSALLMNQYV